MFANTKRLGIISLIAGAANALLGVFLLVFLAGSKLTFQQQFAIGGYVVTASFILIVIGCALFGLGQDLELANDSHAAGIADLKKRVDVLEKR